MPCKQFRITYFIIFSIVLCSFLPIINLHSAIIFVVNSESRTLSKIDTNTNQVQNNFAQLGLIPNKVIVDDNYLWSVNSGDNAVQKINLQTGATVSNLLIETGCNPWDACLNEGFLYVTGLFTNKVYKVNLATNSVVGFVNVGICPEALCVYNGKLYVTNTGGYQNNYANSSVSVIDISTFQVIQTIPVSANPQYIVEHNGLLHVSCTGNWTNVSGNVCVINPVTDEVIQTIAIGGSLGNIWINSGQQALVGDANGYNLYRYNSENYNILNNPANPLSPGGSVVWGDDELIALLYPNWGYNGKVKILHPDLSYWKEYTIALAPTDMKFLPVITAIEDEYQTPAIKVSVYPNPARSGQDINFRFQDGIQGILKIFNTKGQLVYTSSANTNQFTIKASSFSQKQPSGFYLYKLKTDKGSVKGKLIIL